MDLRKQVMSFGLLALASVAFALPALADFGVSFHRYDYDHDGRWNYREFADANHEYYRQHPRTVIMNDDGLRREFRHVDRDNDGLVRVEEVRHYHDW